MFFFGARHVSERLHTQTEWTVLIEHAVALAKAQGCKRLGLGTRLAGGRGWCMGGRRALVMQRVKLLTAWD